MDTRRGGWCGVAAACLTLMVVSACGSQPSAAPTSQRGESPPPVASSPSPDHTQDAATPGADDQACLGVEAIISHITVDTARWSPTVRPFDRDIATRLASEAQNLNAQALAAGVGVRRAVAATATAFGGVADAIMVRSRARLGRAVAQSRIAYSGLKKVCKIRS